MDKYQASPVKFEPYDEILDGTFIRNLVFSKLYIPRRYPSLGRVLRYFLDEDIPALAQAFVESDVDVGKIPSLIPVTSQSELHTAAFRDTHMGITCSDKEFRTDDLEEAMPFIKRHFQTSRLTGQTWAWQTALCAQWKIKSKERYTEGFHEPIQTRHPVLLVGNEFDVVTPIASARNLSASFPGSAVFEHHAHGHGLLQTPSVCAAELIRAYIEDGTLPKDGHDCGVQDPWKEKWWQDYYQALGYN